MYDNTRLYEIIIEEIIPPKFNRQRAMDLINFRTKSVFGFGDDSMTLSELGDRWNISGSRVRQIQGLLSFKVYKRIYKLINFPKVVEKTKLVDMRDSQSVKIKNIDNDELSCRTLNGLKNSRCETIRDILLMPQSKIMKTPNFGRKSLNEIKSFLLEKGYGPSIVGEVPFWYDTQ